MAILNLTVLMNYNIIKKHLVTGAQNALNYENKTHISITKIVFVVLVKKYYINIVMVNTAYYSTI